VAQERFAHDMHDSLRVLVRVIRRGMILFVGAAVLLAGVMMVVLPGPAVVVIPLGLAILALEFAWARRWLERMRRAVRGGSEAVAAAGVAEGGGDGRECHADPDQESGNRAGGNRGRPSRVCQRA
jgi:uncharacterized protein (TIGR02611 family)